jgi:hypothetical protein
MHFRFGKCEKKISLKQPGWYLNFSIWFMKNNVIGIEKYEIMK